MHKGLGTHPSVSMSKDIIKGAEYREDSAFWGYFPTPSVDVSAKDSDTYQTTLRLDQPIWTGGKLDSAYDRAKAEKNEAFQSYDENQYKLIEMYLNTLIEYMESTQKIKVLNENLKQFKSLMRMLDRMTVAGVLSKADKDLLDSRMSNVYSDLVITKAKLKVAKIKFEILVSEPINCDVMFEYQPIFTSEIKVERLVESIKEFHPTLKMLNEQISSAIAEVDGSKSKLWPTLSLRAEHREGSLYTEIAEPADQNLVYFSLQVSPGAGLSSLSDISAAKINVSKMKYQKLTKEKELIDNLMADYISYISAKSSMEVVSDAVKSLKDVYESNKRLFLAQEKKWLDLVNSLSELNRQKIYYSKHLVAMKAYEYKIALQTGKIDLKTGDIISDL